MDHAQGREFHHHLARAIMHLNYLAGLLSFFEPSIEWDDPPNATSSRVGHPNSATHRLHRFVPMPAPSTPPSHPDGIRLTPAPVAGHSDPAPGGRPPKWGVPNTNPDFPRATTRTTTPVPVPSKQRAHPVDAPQSKKKQRAESSAPDLPADPPPLPISTEVTESGLNSDESEEEVPTYTASIAAPGAPTTTSAPTHGPPPGTSAPSESTTATTRTKIVIPQVNVGAPAWYNPWTNAEDQELFTFKNDTKSRPSWKTIGARLHRDPQACKIRWAAIKQLPEYRNRELPSNEPEAED